MSSSTAGNAWDKVRLYPEKKERLVVGLMSGTSVDGIDAALVRISGSRRDTKTEVLGFETYPIDPALRETILDLSHGGGNAAAVAVANFAVGRAFASAAEQVVALSGHSLSQVDFVSSHGQTISHVAPDATLQIGEPAVMAQMLDTPVVSDFRVADMAAGGQGAPLTPYADWCLLTHPAKSRAVQNIGGIGNVTFLPANAKPEQVIGFDTGPGNMLIDRAAAWASGGEWQFDRDGALAARGRIDYLLLEQLLNDPFILKTPPKSAGREEYGAAFFERIQPAPPHGSDGDFSFLTAARGLLDAPRLKLKNREELSSESVSPEDFVATMTAFTALSIADAYDRFLPQMPDEVIVGGGGARNPILMRMLSEKLAPIPVRTHEDVGMNSDSKEAVVFALLANETLLGNPANLPSVTGAKRPVVLGKITLP